MRMELPASAILGDDLALRLRRIGCSSCNVRQQGTEGGTPNVNRDWVLFHLGEAHAELSKTIQEIRGDPDYDYGEFLVAMQHAYTT